MKLSNTTPYQNHNIQKPTNYFNTNQSYFLIKPPYQPTL